MPSSSMGTVWEFFAHEEKMKAMKIASNSGNAMKNSMSGQQVMTWFL